VALPPAYRAFLFMHNGGMPVPNAVDVPRLDGSPTDIQEFLGFDTEYQTSSLAWGIEYAAMRFPHSRLLPIARDGGGNLFCLDLTGYAKAFEIVYADILSGDVFYVAESFEGFLEIIRDIQD
jgi:hypothetical protein